MISKYLHLNSSKLSVILLCLATISISATTGCDPELECEVGERICENIVSRTCVYGKWVDVTCEGASPICDPKHGCVKAQSICGNGAIDIGEACDKDNLANRTCADIIQGSAGTLRCLDTCQYDTSDCKAPEKICTDEDKRCQGTELQKCKDNSWQYLIDCSALNQVCDSNTKSCINGCQGEPRCSDDGKYIISCKDAEESVVPCESGTSCKQNGSGQPECML